MNSFAGLPLLKRVKRECVESGGRAKSCWKESADRAAGLVAFIVEIGTLACVSITYMIHILKEIRILRKEGKLHARLLSQVRILLGISLVLFGIVLYNVFFRGVNGWISLVLAVIGFLLGMFFFSRINSLQWNEEASVVQIAKMDKVGFATLGLYIVFEIGLRTLFNSYFPASATSFILAAIFGTLFGRVTGTMIEIHRVFLKAHH